MGFEIGFYLPRQDPLPATIIGRSSIYLIESVDILRSLQGLWMLRRQLGNAISNPFSLAMDCENMQILFPDGTTNNT